MRTIDSSGWRPALLALVLIVLIALVLFGAYGVVSSRVWELFGLDYAVDGGEWLWIDEQPIYYRTSGNEKGDWLVLVHGFQQTLAKWGMHVVEVDLRGYGHSVRDTSPQVYSAMEQAYLLARVLNQLRVQGATVVGRDRGAAVALALASEQPQFVKQLVLIAPMIGGEIDVAWRPVANVPYLGRAAAWMMDAGGPLWVVEQKRGFYDTLAIPDDYLERIQKPTHIVGTTDALLAIVACPSGNDLSEAISAIDVPVLILRAHSPGGRGCPRSRDRGASLGESAVECQAGHHPRLEKALSNAKLVIIPEAGHYVHIEQKAQVNRLIYEFAQSGAQ